MEKLSEEQVREISDWANSGMAVYINPVTLKYVILPGDDMEDGYAEDDENNPWLEAKQEMEAWDEAEEISKMMPHESFKVMEDFTNTLPNNALKANLLTAFQRKSPFRNFKNLIDDSAYRQQWFDFRDKRYFDYIEEQIDAIIHRKDGIWNEHFFDLPEDV